MEGSKFKVNLFNHFKPMLYLGKFFGIVFFRIRTRGNLIQNLLEFTSPLPLFFCLLHVGYKSCINYASMTYMHSTSVSRTSHFIYYLSTILDSVARYITYYTYKTKLKHFLVQMDNLAEYLENYNPNFNRLRKKLIIFAIISFTMIVSNFVIILSSSMLAAIEILLYHSLQTEFVFVELLITQTIFMEIQKMYSVINKNCQLYYHEEILKSNCLAHHVLSRILLDNNNLFNTSIITTLLTIFILSFNSVHGWVEAIAILFADGPIDTLLTSCYVCYNLGTVWLVWYVIKIRMDIQYEVSPTDTTYIYIHLISLSSITMIHP